RNRRCLSSYRLRLLAFSSVPELRRPARRLIQRLDRSKSLLFFLVCLVVTRFVTVVPFCKEMWLTQIN
ncbi:unnamed protein product, partial [Brassica oleracea]